MALDILIIDDEDDIRDLIAGILEDEGYQARQAHGVETAVFLEIHDGRVLLCHTGGHAAAPRSASLPQSGPRAKPKRLRRAGKSAT